MYFAAKVSIYLLINKKKQSYFSFFNDKISFFQISDRQIWKFQRKVVILHPFCKNRFFKANPCDGELRHIFIN